LAVNNKMSSCDCQRKFGGRLRIIGILVLLLGCAGAGVLYWASAPPEDLPEDAVTALNSKKATRDMEVNFGKAGLLTNNLLEDLEDPATQAIIIVIASILLSAGLFYVAHLQDRANESERPIA
jgi:hypothetical protein